MRVSCSSEGCGDANILISTGDTLWLGDTRAVAAVTGWSEEAAAVAGVGGDSEEEEAGVSGEKAEDSSVPTAAACDWLRSGLPAGAGGLLESLPECGLSCLPLPLPPAALPPPTLPPSVASLCSGLRSCMRPRLTTSPRALDTTLCSKMRSAVICRAGGGRPLLPPAAPADAVTDVPAGDCEAARGPDVEEETATGAGLAAVGAVVHCAVGDRAVTVEGTRALLAAAAAAGVRRFVHLSSVAVYGGAAGALTEATPMVAGDGQDYAAWKAAAEHACLAQQGLDVVRLRPAIVYGPGSKLWVTQLAERIRSGRWGTFGPAGDGTCNLIYIRDVVTAVEHALTQADVAGGVFNLSGDQPITWNEWFVRMADALGAGPLRPIGRLELQTRVLGSLPLKAAARLRPGFAANWLLGAPARSEVALFRMKATYPTQAARAALHWAPAVGLEQGLADSLRRLPAA